MGDDIGINSLVSSPDGKYIFVTGGDRGANLCDFNFSYQKFYGNINSGCFSPETNYLAMGNEKNAELWQIINGVNVEKIHTFKGHKGFINSIAFNADGEYIATASGDNTIKLWDMKQKREIYKLIGHTNSVNTVAFSTNGKRVISGSDDIRIWNIETGKELAVLFLVGEHDWIIEDAAGHFNYSKDAKKYLISKKIISDNEYNQFYKEYYRPDLSLWKILADKESELVNEDESNNFPLKTVIQSGHNSSITCVDLSPDGKYIATGSLDRTAKLWDISTGRTVYSFEGHNEPISSLQFSPNSKYIATGSHDGTIKLWDITTGLEKYTITDFNTVSMVKFTQDGNVLISGNDDQKIKFWDASNGLEIFTINLNYQNSTPFYNFIGRFIFDVMPNLKTLIAVRFDSTADLIDMKTLKKISTLNGHNGLIWGLSLSSDGKYLATCSHDKTAKLWDMSTCHEIYTLKGHESIVNCIKISPNGKYIVTGDGNGIIKLWKLQTGQEIKSFIAHDNQVMSVDFSDDSNLLLTGSFDQTAKLWDLSTGKAIRTFKGYSNNVNAITFNPQGDFLITGTDSAVKLWDISKACIIQNINGYNGGINCLDLSPDGRHILTGSNENSAKIVNISNGSEVLTFSMTKKDNHLKNIINFVDYSPDGRYVITGSRDPNYNNPSLKIWNIDSHKLLYSINEYNNLAHFSFDSKYFLSVRNKDHVAKLRKIANGNEILTFTNPGEGITALDFSPDGKTFVTAINKDESKIESYDTILFYSSFFLKLWNLDSDKPIQIIKGHKDLINSVKFSPSGKHILTGSSDLTAKLWDLNSGKVIHSLEGHTNSVTSVCFSPKGDLIATGSYDNSVKLWKVISGDEIATFVSTGERDYIIFTTDNYYTASRDALKAVHFRRGSKIFPFEQFDLKLNRPDIVVERIGKASPEIIDSYRKAYQKRLHKMGYTEDQVQGDIHLPEISIVSQNIPFSSVSKYITLDVKAFDNKYKLDRLNVYINDVPIYGLRGIDLRNKESKNHSENIKLELSNGENKIQVSVHNEKGTESLKETFYVSYVGDQIKSNLYLLVIGVSQYQNNRYNLAYASKDATNIATLLMNKKNSFFGEVHIKYLLDNNASKENIIEAKQLLEQSNVNDYVIVFIAGHGLVDDEYNYYYGTFDVDHKNPSLRGLPYEEIDNLLNGIPARKKVLFLDTCFSGEIEEKELQLVTTEAVDMVTKGTIKKRAFNRGFILSEKKLNNAVLIQQEIFADLRRGTGAVVISSSAGGEVSFEGKDWQGGVFTYSVIEGMKEMKADKNNDGHIQISELQSYVLDRVQQLTKGEQHPTVRQENLADDFIIY